MGIFERLLNLFFPPTCASCHAEGSFLCPDCRASFKVRPIRKNKYDTSFRKEFKYLNGVIYVADYHQNPQLQAAIHQFKYKFTRELSNEFSTLVASRLSELRMLERRKFFLVPVPLHEKRLAMRGFNQSDLIVNGLANQLPQADVQFILRRIRHTTQQAQLSKEERQKNLEGAFTLASRVDRMKERVCFLVDDVFTTGATLEECAKVLKEAGLKKVYGLVIARAFK